MLYNGHCLTIPIPREDQFLLRIMQTNRFLSSPRFKAQLIRHTVTKIKSLRQISKAAFLASVFSCFCSMEKCVPEKRGPVRRSGQAVKASLGPCVRRFVFLKHKNYCDTLPAKNMEYFLFQRFCCILVECAGCFCTWNTFLRADITLGWAN